MTAFSVWVWEAQLKVGRRLAVGAPGRPVQLPACDRLIRAFPGS
jgi:hypothetical protein